MRAATYHVGVFSVSPAEILTIAVVALLVFGPKRLPEITRKAGKVLRDIRKATDELRTGLESEYKDTLDPIKEALGPIKDARDSIRDAIAGVEREVGGITKLPASMAGAPLLHPTPPEPAPESDEGPNPGGPTGAPDEVPPTDEEPPA